MIVGVIGSGAIGPDLAYGFASALARVPGARVLLHDIRQQALDAGIERIRGAMQKAQQRGKLTPKAAQAIEGLLVPTATLSDLAGCGYVLEAATEELALKQQILRQLEDVVSPDCLIGFATSGLPRAQLVAAARHPQRCFVNHPFHPAARSLPVEVVASDDAGLTRKMLAVLKTLGKVPIHVADVPCFAADDLFCNYCAEAARIVAEGAATPAQVDAIVDAAIGGGGPFHVLDRTRGNPLVVHCLALMQQATGSAWFAPPPLLAEQGLRPWHDRQQPGDPAHDAALGRSVRDRILAVLLARSHAVVERGTCEAGDLNWLTRTALGFSKGLLELAEELGPERVHELCAQYAAGHPGFEVPQSIAAQRLVPFDANLRVTRDGDLALVTIMRPEVKNALDARTMRELERAFEALSADARVRGVVLTSFDGALAGADINELAALETSADAEQLARRGQAVLDRIAALPKPVVAAVDGPVLGGGAELSMSCHARVVGKALMVGQPEVNLGIIPGYGGTQRLPRLIGVERGLELLRTGRPVGAKEACAWGWAAGEPASDPVAAAKALIRAHLDGQLQLAPVDPAPLALPDELPAVDIGHRSRAIDAILVQVCRDGLSQPLPEGLRVEASGFGRCQQTRDFAIGMKNFIENGPRALAAFVHE